MTDVATLGFAINSKPVADAAANLDKMEAAGLRAQSGVEKILASISKQTAEVQKLNSTLVTNASNAERLALAQIKATEAIGKTNEKVRQATGIFSGAAAMVMRFVAALASIQTVRWIAGMVDTWSDLTSRVRLSIGAHNNAADVMDRLAVIARQTYSNFELTADSFTRNATTLNALGKSTQQQLDYTQALNNALVVSGAKGERAVMVQNSLAKAMAEGALKGDDFNNVINYGSRVAQLLADELGVNVTQLRGVAKEGTITGNVIFNSLVKNMEAVTKEAESMPATIADAFTLMRNAVLQTVGVFDQQNKLSESFAQKLIVVADNMGTVISAAVTLAAVAAGIWTTKLLAQAIAFTTALIAQGVQYAQNATLATAWAAAHAGGIAASIASVGALNIALGSLAAGFAGWQIGSWLRENFLEAELAGIALVEGLLVGWEKIKYGSEVAFAAVQYAWDVAIAAMQQVFAAFVRGVASGIDLLPDWAGGSNAQGLRDYADGLRTITGATEDFNGRLAELAQGSNAAIGAIRTVTGEMADDAIAKSSAAKATRELATESTNLATSLGLTAEQLKEIAKTKREVEQATLAAEAAYRSYVQQFEPMLALELEHADALADIERWHALGAISVDRYAKMKAQANRANTQAVAALNRERDVLGALNRDHAQQVAMLSMSRRELAGHQVAVQATERAYAAWGEEIDKMPVSLEELQKAAHDSGVEIFDMGESLSDMEEILSRFDDIGFGNLVSEIEKVKEALKEATDPEQIARLQTALGGLRHEMVTGIVGSSQQALRSMQTMAEEGSDAYKAMQVAIDALTLVQAISAVLNQGQGDPYTAFARMAAMAAAVAQLVGSIGSFQSGFSNTAEQRQASQGTGTVLGDSEAKSESILNATEITADATSTLVGINRGMLRALIQLQDSIGAATGMIARGAGDAEFSALPTPINLAAGSFGSSVLGVPSLVQSLLGGSSRITDQGIVIMGGALMEMLENISVGAYQEVQSRSWRFGSRRTREEMVDVSDEFGRQFQLIIDSIVTTVREGALALGLLPADIEAALESFRIEEIRISTMDLSPEEQQAELLAVFSSIFDGLAGHVVPWIEQFQQVGEGLGETLVRVATSVQVMQEAVRYLGLAIDETDPERFAQISVALIEAAGGIEEFISGMTSFMSAFAPESHRLQVATDALTSAFAQVGLTVPETRDGMWALMQTLDATTEEGREQIATLLRLAGVADEYYQLLERSEEQRRDNALAMIDSTKDLDMILMGVDQAFQGASGGATDWAAAMAEMEERNRQLIERAIGLGASEEELERIRRFAQMRLDDLVAAEEEARRGYNNLITSLHQDGWSEPIQGLMRLYDEYQQQVSALNEAARAAGRTGASTWALAAAQAAYERQLRRFAAQLLQTARGLLGQLGYQGYEEFGQVNEAEARGINEVTQAVEDRYARELELLQQLDEFVRGLGTSALSPLTPRQQLQEAEGEYMRLLALAQSGDLDALAQLQGAASNYLGQAQGFYGGVGPYQEIFELVRGQLGALVGAGPQSQPMGPTTPVIGGPVTVDPGAAWGQMNALERALLAQQLVDHLAALSLALRTPILQLLEDLNIPLTQLVEDLGINIREITGASVEALAQLAYDLGLPLGELVEALGLELPDLADGVRELAEELGINLAELTGETAFQLADLARRLNVDLNDLTTSLGIDLGRLTDVNSPIFQALSQTIGTLPEEQAGALREYLEAIAQSPDGESAAANIAAMEDYINTLDADIALALAPFFGGVNPPGGLTELDYLGYIDDSLRDLLDLIDGSEGTNSILTSIEQAIRDAAGPTGVTGYAAGGMVNGPTMAWIGESGRELVLPNSVTEFFARNGIPVNSSGSEQVNREIRRELYDLRQQQMDASRRVDMLLIKISDGADRSAKANERAADAMEQRR